jgi:hypothetical protein
MTQKKENQLQMFDVTVKIVAEVAVTIKASSLEEALAAGRTLKETRFVDWKGDLYDLNMSVIGVRESEPA